MTPARTQRLLTWCGAILLVLGIPGAIFANDSLQRGAQFLAIGMGVIALVTARVLLPWGRRAHQDRSE